MKELKANPNRNAIATVLESHLDSKLWPVATLLINTWTINSWDNIVCSSSFWKIKILKNYLGQNIKKAFPWDPVFIVWLNRVVDGWDILQVVKTPESARQKWLEYEQILQKEKKDKASSLDVLMTKIKSWNLKQLKVIVKADTNWSLEAIKAQLEKLSTPETTVQIIHHGVWWITEGDILMWEWSQAILVWFNVQVLSTAKNVLELSNIEYINSNIIYHITERIEKIVTWMLDPKEVEVNIWIAKVWWIFYNDKKFMIVWLILPEFKNDWESNKIENKAQVRVIRKKKIVWTWKIDSLKSWTLEVKELDWPSECWVKFIWDIDLEVWDEFEIYKTIIEK
jgi:translation initiation factor IF-2